MRITIGDVARRAGVGRGTVSRVLNNRPNVDPATRARVLAVIGELDFVPSAAARRLSTGRSQTVAVVVPFLARPSSVERLRGIESTLVAAGLDMIAMNVESVARRDAILREVARPERIDGLVLVSIAPTDDELGRIAHTGLAVVLVDAHHRRLPRVVADDIGGGRVVAQHLLALGHRRLGFVGDHPHPRLGSASGRLRMRGIVEALRHEGLSMREEDIALAEHGRSAARSSAATILARPDRPSAIVAASDTEALGVLQAAADLGLSVPEDLSLIGCDDIEAADVLGLTTIRRPLFEMGERAVRRLVDRIADGDGQPLREVLPVTLVVRRSTGPAPG